MRNADQRFRFALGIIQANIHVFPAQMHVGLRIDQIHRLSRMRNVWPA